MRLGNIVRRLDGMDAMLLYSETSNLVTHTMKVAILDGGRYEREHGKRFEFEDFRLAVQNRMHLLAPLRFRLLEVPFKLHHPMWMENCPVDLEYHLRRAQISAPGGSRELDAVLGRIAGSALDRRYPLWEFYFAEGLADGRIALIAKVHHTLADGLASANLLGRLFDVVGAPSADVVRYTTRQTPSRGALLAAAGRDHLRQFASMPALAKDVVLSARRFRRGRRRLQERRDMAKMFRAPSTFLNHVVSPRRTVATASVALADIKNTAKHFEVSFNDVVLAMAAGAMRELMSRYEHRVDQPILASVPVSADVSTQRASGNDFSGLMVSLPVHVDTAAERMRLTAMSSNHAKHHFGLVDPSLPNRLMRFLPTAVAPLAFRWHAKHATGSRLMNVAVSSVPGPRQQGHLGGAVVSEIISVGTLTAGSAVNITVWSYIDRVAISVLSDDRTFADVHEATDALLRALDELKAAAGASVDNTGSCKLL